MSLSLTKTKVNSWPDHGLRCQEASPVSDVDVSVGVLACVRVCVCVCMRTCPLETLTGRLQPAGSMAMAYDTLYILQPLSGEGSPE